MSRYVDADELKKLVEEEFKGVCVYDVSPDEAISDFCDVVDNCSSADVAPVELAHWIQANDIDETAWRCSKCNLTWILNEGTPSQNEMRYCPKCGAYMIESEDSGNERQKVY